MNLSQLLFVLRARKAVIFTVLLITVAVAVAVSLRLPKTYKATATIVLNYKGYDTVTGLSLPASLMPGYMATQLDIINSKALAARVADELGLAGDPAVVRKFNEATRGQGNIRDWLAEYLLKKVEAVPSRDSGVLNISFKHSDPVFAAAAANAYANQYQRIAIELKIEPFKKAGAYFNEQIQVLRANVEASQRRLSKYQQDNGIVSLDNRMDAEMTRLNELSVRLVEVQTQLADANARRLVTRAEGTDASPDLLGNALLQNLKLALAQAEAKLSQLREKFEENHPQYLASKAEIDELRSALRRYTEFAAHGLNNTMWIVGQRERELRNAIEEQKRKVLALNRTKDELAVLSKESEAAQRAYDAIVQRFNQINLEGQAQQNEISVLAQAVPPATFSSPKIFLNTLMALLLGAMNGIGLAVLMEMRDRRIRSSLDLLEAAQVPVLGVVRWEGQKPSRFRAASTTITL